MPQTPHDHADRAVHHSQSAGGHLSSANEANERGAVSEHHLRCAQVEATLALEARVAELVQVFNLFRDAIVTR